MADETQTVGSVVPEAAASEEQRPALVIVREVRLKGLTALLMVMAFVLFFLLLREVRRG